MKLNIKFTINIWGKVIFTSFVILSSMIIAVKFCHPLWALFITFLNGVTVGMWIIMILNYLDLQKRKQLKENDKKEILDFIQEMNQLYSNNEIIKKGDSNE